MEIVIDERETFLYDKCLEMVKESKYHSEITIKKQVLPLGDILISFSNGTPLLIIERKALSDLLSSIKDGRYEEQSYRLIHSEEYPRNHVYYLLEGMFSTIRSPQDKKTIISTMSSLQLFKGFHVVRTCSMLETAEWIVFTADKIRRDLKKGRTLFTNTQSTIVSKIEPEFNTNILDTPPTDSLENQEPEQTQEIKAYCTVVKKVKKENITKENMGEILLCQIPGISSQTAIAIMNHCNHSFLQLIDILKTNPTSLETILINKKKISKKIIEAMIHYLGCSK
jgi:ERCC4-type nuclease